MSQQTKKSALSIYLDSSDPSSICLKTVIKEKDIPIDIRSDLSLADFLNETVRNKPDVEELKTTILREIDDKKIKELIDAKITTYLASNPNADNQSLIEHLAEGDEAFLRAYMPYAKDIMMDEYRDQRSIDLYGAFPTLVLHTEMSAIINFNVIFEYFEDRFPHPPLMPVFPQKRSKMRMFINTFIEEIFPALRMLDNPEASEEDLKQARRTVIALMIDVLPLVRGNEYIFGEEYSIADCLMTSAFIYATKHKIKLPEGAGALVSYGKRLFTRPSFQLALKA